MINSDLTVFFPQKSNRKQSQKGHTDYCSPNTLCRVLCQQNPSHDAQAALLTLDLFLISIKSVTAASRLHHLKSSCMRSFLSGHCHPYSAILIHQLDEVCFEIKPTFVSLSPILTTPICPPEAATWSVEVVKLSHFFITLGQPRIISETKAMHSPCHWDSKMCLLRFTC